jgi:phage gp29-like protein
MNNLTKTLTDKTDFSNFIGYMPNPDLILSKGGLKLDVFEEMLTDAHISAKLEQLKHGALSKAWSIVPADSSKEAGKIASYVKNHFQTLPNFFAETEEMLSAVEYGFSVTEVVWKKAGAYWVVEKLLNRSPERFAFNSQGRLILNDLGSPTLLDEPYKFIVHRHMSRNENPYGSPVLSKCYWPWIFKKAGFRFWLTVAEKFGVPTVLAMFSSEGGDETRRRAQSLAESLHGIQNDAAVALANVDSVQVLESKGSSEDFARLIDVCNSEISKAITGEILTSDTGSGGSYALAKEHSKTFQSKATKIGACLAETISSTLVRWICELNFGKSVKYPSFIYEDKVIADWNTIKDAVAMGLDIDKQEVARQFGIPLKSH